MGRSQVWNFKWCPWLHMFDVFVTAFTSLSLVYYVNPRSTWRSYSKFVECIWLINVVLKYHRRELKYRRRELKWIWEFCDDTYSYLCISSPFYATGGRLLGNRRTHCYQSFKYNLQSSTQFTDVNSIIYVSLFLVAFTILSTLLMGCLAQVFSSWVKSFKNRCSYFAVDFLRGIKSVLGDYWNF